ncbi:lipase family protein [Streptomyces sp. NPDC058620]|uniref:lipase family protein n=1 Tax=Streptomyces sp. NPDC058620 TaxID=3346560 RepID=UPI00364E1768
MLSSNPGVFYLDPLKAIKADASVHWIMYRPTDRAAKVIAVTGTVLNPRTSQFDQSPILAFAPGTQARWTSASPPGGQVRPSRRFAAGTEYEALPIKQVLDMGYAVVVTDYQGLGTPGVRTYMDREARGRAVLDSIPSGSAYRAFFSYALSGLATAYGIAPYPIALSKRVTNDLRDSLCRTGPRQVPFLSSRFLTPDGSPLTERFKRAPWETITAVQQRGKLKPAVPVLLSRSALDDVVPRQVGKNLAADWCRRGATGHFVCNHISGRIAATAGADADADAEGLPWLRGPLRRPNRTATLRPSAVRSGSGTRKPWLGEGT